MGEIPFQTEHKFLCRSLVRQIDRLLETIKADVLLDKIFHEDVAKRKKRLVQISWSRLEEPSNFKVCPLQVLADYSTSCHTNKSANAAAASKTEPGKMRASAFNIPFQMA